MLNELAVEINKWAVDQGFYDRGERNFGEILMLICSEAAEALEEYRKGRGMTYTYYSMGTNGRKKPEGIPTELADIIIRVLDIMHHHGIDIDHVVREKLEYNKTRPYRHGGMIA